MKKSIYLLLATVLVVELTACGGGGGASTSTKISSAPTNVSSASTNISSVSRSVSSASTSAGIVSLSLTAPSNEALVPLNGIQNLSITFANTTAAKLTWKVLPTGVASYANITLLSSTANSAVFGFTASKADNYTVQFSSQDDTTKSSQIDLHVHNVYSTVDAYLQNATYLQEDGTIKYWALTSSTSGVPTGKAKAVAQGALWAAAVMIDGSVQTWGIVSASVPVGLTQVKKISAGSYFAMAIKEDDTLVVWGGFNMSNVTIPSSLVTAKFLAADALLNKIVAIKVNGDLVVWDGLSGTLDTNPTAWAGKKFTQVCATNYHVVALDDTGKVWSWRPEYNFDLEMDIVPTTNGSVAAIFCGDMNAALLQTNGRVMSWGEGTDFDSDMVANFPAIKSVVVFSYNNLRFLTVGGAVLDMNLQVDNDL